LGSMFLYSPFPVLVTFDIPLPINGPYMDGLFPPFFPTILFVSFYRVDCTLGTHFLFLSTPSLRQAPLSFLSFPLVSGVLVPGILRVPGPTPNIVCPFPGSRFRVHVASGFCRFSFTSFQGPADAVLTPQSSHGSF